MILASSILRTQPVPHQALSMLGALRETLSLWPMMHFLRGGVGGGLLFYLPMIDRPSWRV